MQRWKDSRRPSNRLVQRRLMVRDAGILQFIECCLVSILHVVVNLRSAVMSYRSMAFLSEKRCRDVLTTLKPSASPNIEEQPIL